MRYVFEQEMGQTRLELLLTSRELLLIDIAEQFRTYWERREKDGWR